MLSPNLNPPRRHIKRHFITKYGQFYYSLMELGLGNAPDIFQSLLNLIFGDFIDNFVIIYIDGVLILCESKEEHISHINILLNIIEKNKLYLSPKEWNVLRKQVEFLELLAGRHRIRVENRNVEVINIWRKPNDLTDHRGFIDLLPLLRLFKYVFAPKCFPETPRNSTSGFECHRI